MTNASEVVGTDEINHPSHYTYGAIEAIEVIEDWGLGFHLGNAVKYICRADRKGELEGNLRKAIWYIERYIVHRKRKDAKPGDVDVAEPIDDESADEDFYRRMAAASQAWFDCRCSHCEEARAVDSAPELVWQKQGLCERYRHLQAMRREQKQREAALAVDPLAGLQTDAERTEWSVRKGTVPGAELLNEQGQSTESGVPLYRDGAIVSGVPRELAVHHPDYSALLDRITEREPLEVVEVITADGKRKCWGRMQRMRSEDGKYEGRYIRDLYPDPFQVMDGATAAALEPKRLHVSQVDSSGQQELKANG